MNSKQNTNNIIQRRQVQQLQANEGKSFVKLNEADLRYVVSESVRRIIKEYTDHPIFGWDYVKKRFKKAKVNDEDLAKLKKSYDAYAQETISKGKTPNDTGFDLWCFDKEYQAQQQGIRNLYPDYLHSIN